MLIYIYSPTYSLSRGLLCLSVKVYKDLISYKYVSFVFKSLQAGMLNSVSTALAKLFYDSKQINKSNSFYTRYLPESELLQNLVKFLVLEGMAGWHEHESLLSLSPVNDVSSVKSFHFHFRNTSDHVCPSHHHSLWFLTAFYHWRYGNQLKKKYTTVHSCIDL